MMICSWAGIGVAVIESSRIKKKAKLLQGSDSNQRSEKEKKKSEPGAI